MICFGQNRNFWIFEAVFRRKERLRPPVDSSLIIFVICLKNKQAIDSKTNKQ